MSVRSVRCLAILTNVIGILGCYLLLLQACSIGACTAVGCKEMVYLDFSAPKEKMTPGRFSLYVKFGVRESICRFEIEKPIGGQFVQRVQIYCEGAAFERAFMSRSSWRNFEVIGVLPVHEIPKSLQIKIQRESQVLINGSFSVKSRVFYPNGESCEPKCSDGRVFFAVQ